MAIELQEVITGILTGGAGALTSLLGGFRTLQKKLADLEEAVGKTEPNKSGLHLAVSLIEESMKRLRRDIESWEDQPPRWAERLIARARGGSQSDLTSQIQFEERVATTLRSYNDRLGRVQDDLAEVLQQMKDIKLPDDYLSRDEYLSDSRQRAEDMIRVREQIATANGLLRGVMSAMGMIDPERSERPKPPRPGR